MRIGAEFLVLLIAILAAVPSMARTLVDDDSGDVSSQSSYYKQADTDTEMRKIRRAGIGLQAAGALGVGGAVLDLNFTPVWSGTVGFGGGSGFQAFEAQAKYVLAGDWLMPYMTFGFARWASIGNRGPIGTTSPAILGDRLLNDSEKAAGEFQKNLIYPGLGLQYEQLTGDWAGSSIYGELTVLMDIGNLVAAPAGAVGIMYYF